LETGENIDGGVLTGKGDIALRYFIGDLGLKAE
jgi:hypothetical protein